MAKGRTKNDNAGNTRRRRDQSSQADWASCNPELLQELVCRLGVLGGAARFGYSRDAGAYAIGVYGDGEPFTEYLSGTSDVDEWLQGLILDYEG